MSWTEAGERSWVNHQERLADDLDAREEAERRAEEYPNGD